MDEFRKKKKFRQLLFSNVSLVLLLVILVFAVRGTWHMYATQRSAWEARGESERQRAALQSRRDFLTTEVDQLKTDGGVERKIREKFSVVKPGEKVAVIVDSTTSAPELPPQPTFWERIKSWF